MAHLSYHERPARAPAAGPPAGVRRAGTTRPSRRRTRCAVPAPRRGAAEPLATLDSEEFYHYGLQRPQVTLQVPGHDRAGDHLARHRVLALSRPPSPRPRRPDRRSGPSRTSAGRRTAGRCWSWRSELEVGLIVTMGALLAEVPHTRPVRLTGFATDPELAALLRVRPTRYEGPTGIVGVLSSIARTAGLATASLWANVPHYISAVENPRATLALVHGVNRLLDGPIDVRELEEAGAQFDAQLAEVLAQNRKVATYVRKLEARGRRGRRAAPRVPGRAAERPGTWSPRSSGSCASSPLTPSRSEASLTVRTVASAAGAVLTLLWLAVASPALALTVRALARAPASRGRGARCASPAGRTGLRGRVERPAPALLPGAGRPRGARRRGPRHPAGPARLARLRPDRR